MAEVKAQKKAEKKEAKAAEAAVPAERDRPAVDALRLMWSRMGEACKQAGVDYNEVCDEADIYAALPPKDATALLTGSGKLTVDTRSPFGYVVGRDDISSLVKLADLLGCSLDYLFGRDVPESGTGSATTSTAPSGGNVSTLYLTSAPRTRMPSRSPRLICSMHASASSIGRGTRTTNTVLPVIASPLSAPCAGR